MIVGNLSNLRPAEIGLPALAKFTPASEANFIESATGEVDSKLQVADAEKAKVLTGETNNLHQAVIAMQEANVAFSLMVEVRNKLVESYQELMRTQV
jgi:flagellar hook-basal body complex protein FliE